MRRSVPVAVAIAVLVAGCGSSRPSASGAYGVPTSTTTSAPATTAACSNSAGPDYIVWEVSPGAQPAAQELGAYNLGKCEPTPDWLKATSPVGAGYCTLVAPASADPDYDVNASPAPRPKGVVESIGGAC